MRLRGIRRRSDGRYFYSSARAVSADGTVVAGNSDSDSGGEAFRWTESGGMVGLGALPGGIYRSEASALSADGRVVVGGSVAGHDKFGDVNQAFRWTESGGMQGLGGLNGTFSYAYGVSGDGTLIVGTSSIHAQNYAGSEITAFVWNEYMGIRRLSDILAAQGTDLTGWTLDEAEGISADGRYVIGYGRHNGVTQAFRAELAPLPFPEPTTFAALALGGLGLCRQRRKRELLSPHPLSSPDASP